MPPDDGNREVAEKLRAAEGREAKFRMLAQKAKDAIIATDRGGMIEYMNRSAERLFGRSLEEAQGQPITFVLPRKFTNNPESPGTVRVEAVGLRKDGSEFPVRELVWDDDASLAEVAKGLGSFAPHVVIYQGDDRLREAGLRTARGELARRADIPAHVRDDDRAHAGGLPLRGEGRFAAPSLLRPDDGLDDAG